MYRFVPREGLTDSQINECGVLRELVQCSGPDSLDIALTVPFDQRHFDIWKDQDRVRERSLEDLLAAIEVRTQDAPASLG